MAVLNTKGAAQAPDVTGLWKISRRPSTSKKRKRTWVDNRPAKGVRDETRAIKGLEEYIEIPRPRSIDERGACVGMGREGLEIFFPGKGKTQVAYAKARAICASCPVLDDCREWVMNDRTYLKHGFAGGLTPQERKAIRDGSV